MTIEGGTEDPAPENVPGGGPRDPVPGEKHGAFPRRQTDSVAESVYQELRDLAHLKVRKEYSGQSLRSTELVHEAYLRLKGGDRAGWESRAHFLGAAAEAMRRILIERARSRGREKRGGDADGRPPKRISFADVPVADLALDYDPNEIIALESAIERLAVLDSRAASVVKLRFYAGLSIDETAEALDIAPRTVKRDWTFAKAWLLNEVG